MFRHSGRKIVDRRPLEVEVQVLGGVIQARPTCPIRARVLAGEVAQKTGEWRYKAIVSPEALSRVIPKGAWKDLEEGWPIRFRMGGAVFRKWLGL